ncbi:MAG: hypothetical protein MdMp024_0945 [Bacteroidales bacterium]
MNKPPHIKEFSKAVGIPVAKLLSRCHHREVVEARFVYWYLALANSPYTARYIGEWFGFSTYTVVHGRDRVKELLSIKDPYITSLVEKTEGLWAAKNM